MPIGTYELRSYAMPLTSFPTDPYVILDPPIRSYLDDELLIAEARGKLIPPLVEKVRHGVKSSPRQALCRRVGHDAGAAEMVVQRASIWCRMRTAPWRPFAGISRSAKR